MLVGRTPRGCVVIVSSYNVSIPKSLLKAAFLLLLFASALPVIQGDLTPVTIVMTTILPFMCSETLAPPDDICILVHVLRDELTDSVDFFQRHVCNSPSTWMSAPCSSVALNVEVRVQRASHCFIHTVVGVRTADTDSGNSAVRHISFHVSVVKVDQAWDCDRLTDTLNHCCYEFVRYCGMLAVLALPASWTSLLLSMTMTVSETLLSCCNPNSAFSTRARSMLKGIVTVPITIASISFASFATTGAAPVLRSTAHTCTQTTKTISDPSE